MKGDDVRRVGHLSTKRKLFAFLFWNFSEIYHQFNAFSADVFMLAGLTELVNIV